jgi:hypothetical protein
VSSKNNVNPDHYKIAGRNRPNERRPEGSRPAERDVQPRERWNEREKEKKNAAER